MAEWHLVQTRRAVFRLQCFQLLFVVLVALGFFFVRGTEVALSVIMGGVVCILPGVYFAFRVLRKSGISHLRQIATEFWIGEAFKILLTGVMFYITLRYTDVHIFGLMVGFLSAQLFFLCLAPFFIN
jgi:ATP synthase protein I